MPQHSHVATLHTNHGDIVVNLFGDHAPKTVAKILGRAKTVGREPLYLVYRLLEGIRHPA